MIPGVIVRRRVELGATAGRFVFVDFGGNRFVE